MSTIIDALGYSASAVALFEAISAKMSAEGKVGRDEITKVLAGKGQNVEVKVTVNGVEVDYVETLQTTIDRWYEALVTQYEQQVREAALELLKGSRLRPLLDQLEALEWGFERALNEAEKVTA